MSERIAKVGWLGTGRMGAAMAHRLLDAGEQLAVWNRTREKTEPLAAKGALVVDELGDLARCEIVFVSVLGPADLEEVVTGEAGLLVGDMRPEVVVDTSTVSIEASATVRAACAAAGVGFVAAPVSGNAHVVAEGGACMMASGAPEVVARVQPLLDEIAKLAVYVGAEEQARLVKLCHNLYLGMMVQALAEVTSLAEKGGTPRAAFLEFIDGTVLGSDWVRKRTPDLVAGDLTPTFTTELLRKDFDLGLGAARILEVPMPVGAMVHQLIQVAIGNGWRDADLLALYALQAKTAGLTTS